MARATATAASHATTLDEALFSSMLLQDTNLRMDVFLHQVFRDQHHKALKFAPIHVHNIALHATYRFGSLGQMPAAQRDPTKLTILQPAIVRNLTKGSIGTDHDNIEKMYSISLAIARSNKQTTEVEPNFVMWRRAPIHTIHNINIYTYIYNIYIGGEPPFTICDIIILDVDPQDLGIIHDSCVSKY